MLKRLIAVALVAGCSSSTPTQYAPASVPQGGACNYGIDCAPVDGGSATCLCAGGGNHTCRAVIPLPMNCGSINSPPCPDDQYCGTDATHPSGVCLPRVGVGASCDTFTVSCQAGLFCNLIK